MACTIGHEPPRYGRNNPYEGEEGPEKRIKAAQEEILSALCPALLPAPRDHTLDTSPLHPELLLVGILFSHVGRKKLWKRRLVLL